jgi:hypothetical protein
MKLTKIELRRAVSAVLATMGLCVCLSYLTFQLFIGHEGNYAFYLYGWLCYFALFMDLAICAFYTGKRLIDVLIKCRWKGSDKIPQIEKGSDKVNVAFITKDNFIMNGVYRPDDKQFRSYDGLVFRYDEIVSWCYDRRSDYFVKIFRYPTNHESRTEKAA